MITVGYGVVLACSALLVYQRYLQYIRYPDDAIASSGMYAFGDMLLAIFICFLLMIPTIFLIRVMSRYEGKYAVYSKILLGLSATAPISLGVMFIHQIPETSLVRDLSLWRLLWSPLVFVGLGISRLMAKFVSSKRLSSYALLLEGATIAISIAMIIGSVMWHKR